jgi:hypothetical protein
MPLSAPEFAAWLDRYVAAWRSNDPADVGALFSADCSYSYRAGTEVVIGRDAIVASWLESPDDPTTWEARYEPLAVDGEVHVSVGWSRYLNADGSLRDEYSNIFVCRFDEVAQCTEFMEWWMRVGPPEAS